MSSREEIRRNPLSAYVQVRKNIGKRQDKAEGSDTANTRCHWDTTRGLIAETTDLLRRYDELMSGTVVTIGRTPYQSGLTSDDKDIQSGQL